MKKFIEKIVSYLKHHWHTLLLALAVVLVFFVLVFSISCRGLWSVGLNPTADGNTIVMTENQVKEPEKEN